jgi:predicted GNAT family acetyltransferase
MTDIVDDRERMRFETERDGHVAYLVYERHGNRLVLVHTEVPTELEGHGLGGALVTAAIDHAAEHDLEVDPQCPFARAWLRRHPDVAGRVVIDWPD